MGIYFHGLDAPEKCNGCCMNLTGHCLANKGLYVGRDNLEYNSKPDWCPAMNIQPHGRLIDADALRRAMYHEAFETDSPMQKWDSGCWIRYKLFERMEEAAPTIIPADGGDDNG